MPEIHLSQSAARDLDEIFDYVAEDSIPAAMRLVRLIEEKLTLLRDNPRVGRARHELYLECRSFPAGNYLLFYRPVSDGIEVLRILHERMDVQTLGPVTGTRTPPA